MRLLTLALLFVSASSFAGEYVSRKLSLSVGGMGGWNTTYYNCDSLEDRVEDHLENLGATNVSVRCFGGIGWGNVGFPSPANVTAKFDAPVPAGDQSSTRTIKSRFADSCEADVQILDAALPLFPGIKVLSRKASCSFGSRTGRWSYDLSVTE